MAARKTPPARRAAALVGVGRMGAAMAAGWLADLEAAGLSGVTLLDPHPSETAKALGETVGAILNPETVSPVDVLILAVKPQVFAEAAPLAAAWVGPKTLVLSVMAGITLERLAEAFGPVRLVRAMPNTPGALGQGVTAFCLSDACKAADAKMVASLLSPLGLVEGPVPESMMDAVTAISGSGPAYAFLLVETMAAAGRHLGLPEDMAMRLALQTVVGAGALLAQDGADAAALRKAVTSPGGTTQAALDVLMGEKGVPDIMRRAAEAAARRSAELSKGG